MRYKVLLLLLMGYNSAFGQSLDRLTYGLKLGVLSSRINNLPEMLIGRDYNKKVSFHMEGLSRYGVEGGFFVNYKIPHSRLGLQPELLYRVSGGRVHSSSQETTYTLDLNYHYLVLGGQLKLYPYRGITLGFGVHYSKILNPSSLEYTSDENQGLYDTSYRQFYRDGIVGRDDISLSSSLGYEFSEFLHIEARYYYGLSDVVGNQSTSFQFLENSNKTSVFSLSIGYNFSQW